MWDPKLRDLSRRQRVLRVNLRGFGDSPLPPDHYDHVTDVVAVLDEVGVDGAAVVGASFGGQVPRNSPGASLTGSSGCFSYARQVGRPVINLAVDLGDRPRPSGDQSGALFVHCQGQLPLS